MRRRLRRRHRNPKIDPVVVGVTLGGLAVAGIAIYYLTKKPAAVATTTPGQLVNAAGV